MKVSIEFNIRRIEEDPEEPEESPSDPFDDETTAKVERVVDAGLNLIEESMFDAFGWTFDDATIKVSSSFE